MLCEGERIVVQSGCQHHVPAINKEIVCLRKSSENAKILSESFQLVDTVPKYTFVWANGWNMTLLVLKYQYE